MPARVGGFYRAGRSISGCSMPGNWRAAGLQYLADLVKRQLMDQDGFCVLSNTCLLFCPSLSESDRYKSVIQGVVRIHLNPGNNPVDLFRREHGERTNGDFRQTGYIFWIVSLAVNRFFWRILIRGQSPYPIQCRRAGE